MTARPLPPQRQKVKNTFIAPSLHGGGAHAYREALRPLDQAVSKLYRDGLSTYEIAQSLRLTQGRVARSLRRTNTSRRDKSEAALIKFRAETTNG